MVRANWARRTASLLPALALFTVGCKSAPRSASAPPVPTPNIVGKWKIAPGVPTAITGTKGGLKTDVAESFRFEFKADGTFTGSNKEGTYKQEGLRVTLTTTKLMGVDVAKVQSGQALAPMPGKVAADGTSIVMNPPKTGYLPDKLSSIKIVRDGP